MTAPRILIIAGSDSGGGAGIQADIKTVTMLGGHAMTAITALTAQNTVGVQGVMPVPAGFVIDQIDSVVSDIGIDAVKIGMIGAPETANAVADRLESLAAPIVFDPVMVATSGAVLAERDTIAGFERLMDICTIVTPNLPELEALADTPVVDDEARLMAAATLHERHGCAVLAKGGHAEGEDVVDLLLLAGRTIHYRSTRLDTRHTHGTGCSLASGVATGLGAGLEMERAVDRALKYVHAALIAAPGLGRRTGPVGHALGTIPYHHIKAAESGGDWGVETWDAVWAPRHTKH
jgi:hydroxymethylpyrimidine/phosphomethylpyrimidine kinase